MTTGFEVAQEKAETIVTVLEKTASNESTASVPDNAVVVKHTVFACLAAAADVMRSSFDRNLVSANSQLAIKCQRGGQMGRQDLHRRPAQPAAD